MRSLSGGVLVLAVLVACGTTATSSPDEDLAAAVLNAVVESELSQLDSPTDESFTVVLTESRLVAVPLDVRAVTHGVLGDVEHRTEWLSAQAATPRVAGTCDLGSLRECWVDESTVVLAISEPAFDAAGSVAVQVAKYSRSTDPNGRPRSFFSQVLLTLADEGTGWRVAARRVLGIT